MSAPLAAQQRKVEIQTETALHWLLRSRELALSAAATMDGTPRAAADAFLCRRRPRRRCRGRTGAKKRGEEVVAEAVSEGTGISFVDEILRWYRDHGGAVGDAPHDRRGRPKPPGAGGTMVLEASGGRGTGKTSLLLGLASSYLAATMPHPDDDDEDVDGGPDADRSSHHYHYGAPAGGGKRRRDGVEGGPPDGGTPPVRNLRRPQTRPPPPPNVIFLDCEHGLRVPQLVSSVRASVLREMRRRRQCRGRRRRRDAGDGADHDDAENRGAQSNTAVDGDGGDDDVFGHDGEGDDDADRVEKAVARNLSRVHVAWPRTDGDLTAIMEQISHALRSGKQRHAPSKYAIAASAPTMVVIDSINSFEQRDRMSNGISSSSGTDQHGGKGGGGSTGVGFGTRADFLRQLNRLLVEHPGTIVLASRVLFYPGGGGGGNREGFGGDRKDPWNRIVTHRVTLEKVAEGTTEQSEGFEFVAVSERPRLVVPFSVASGGMFC